MADRHTLEELNNCSREELITIVLMMQGQLDTLNENIERLIEQVRIANSYRFGKHAETLDSIDGQLSFFDEAESCCDLSVPEPAAEEVLPSRRNHKKKGQREMNLKDFPEEILPPYQVSTEELDTFYGAGNWRRMKDETYKRLRHEPESWTVEVHTVEVYVGTGGDHQDEFLRGKRPRDLLRGSIVTPSLLASILNVKYVNSSALHRVEQEFQRNGVNISRQTMSNWIIRCAEKYFAPFVERMKQELLSLPVTQSDVTPTQVIGDSDRPNSKCYMWVHRSGEFYKERPVVIYEYQKGRDHEKPLEFYRSYKGVLVTDSLEQYHLLDKKLSGVTNANCWAHARRKFRDSLPNDLENAENTLPIIAMNKIKKLFAIEKEIEVLSPDKKVKIRQLKSKPLIDDFFSWCKSNQNATASAKLSRAFKYVLNHEEGLRQYLYDGYIPMTNSLDERVIRPFTTGRKNWLFSASVSGAESSANAYSIIETAKANGLDPYKYLTTIFTYLPSQDLIKNPEIIDEFLPWSEFVQKNCK